MINALNCCLHSVLDSNKVNVKKAAPDLTEQQSTQPVNVPSSSYPVNTSDSANLMSRNFCSPDSKPSRYITAQLSSLKNEKSIGNKMNSMVETLAAGITGENKYTQAVINKTKSAEMARRIGASAVMEDHQEQLEASRDQASDQKERAAENAGSTDTHMPKESHYPSSTSAEREPATVSKDAAGSSVDITV